MSEKQPCDPHLRVTSSGVVHLPTCSHVQAPNSGATRWEYRYDHDRPCRTCRPDFPTNPTPDGDPA